MQITDRTYTPAPVLLRTLRNLSLFGLIVFVAGLFLNHERVWGGYLMGFHFFTALALAGPFFLALLYVTGSSWATALQRIPEAMGKALPAALVLGVVLIAGLPSLYEWSHASVVEHDALLAHKSPYLNTTGFALRLLAMFAIWIFFSRKLSARSLSSDPRHGPRSGATLKLSALFVAVFAITYSVANFDWLMSMEPHWFSTIFGLYQLAGLASAGCAVAIILAIYLEKRGPLRGILRDDHVHDMAKLLFAFTLFWAYIWYCQYMLIWYADIPEETSYYLHRQEGPWWLLVRSTLAVKWGLPFLALLSRWACRNRVLVVRVAAIVLLGHAMDLFAQVGPPLMGSEAKLGIWEIGPVLGAVSFFFLLTIRNLSRESVVPAKDPRLAESMHYHTS
ncbi:MAG: hypothetical protein QF599_13125 [Planctomycetota bacterium]|jgi:hypothetical protein|nr:hypothetical protein [Planctomycetota bacterium]MDP6518610.1 hypothetical protein [Planctomycetota bacterium]MDP6956906.1 hypothetical protein [Planctomycetota bacterium]